MKTESQKGANTSGVHLWLILWKAFRAMGAQADRSIAGFGLCQSDFGVMEALLHKGPLAVKALGEKVLLTSGSMTAAVDRLEKRGWVERGNDPGDRRVRIVRLTAGGRKTIETLFADHERDMERAVERLSADERSELANLLRRLGKSVQTNDRTSLREVREVREVREGREASTASPAEGKAV